MQSLLISELHCTALVYSVTAVKTSTDQYHMNILQAQVQNSSRSHYFLKFTADQVLVFQVNLLISARLFGRHTNVFRCFCFV